MYEIGAGRPADSGEDLFNPIGIEESHEALEYYDDGGVPENDSPSPSSRGNISFTALAQDEKDTPEEEDQSPVSSRADKGKGRAEAQDSGDEDTGIEEDIAADLQEIEDVYEDQEQDEPGPSRKKSRKNNRLSSDSEESNNPRNKPSRKTQPKRTQKQPRISMYGKIL